MSSAKQGSFCLCLNMLLMLINHGFIGTLTRMQPAVFVNRGSRGIRFLPIALHYMWAPETHLTILACREGATSAGINDLQWPQSSYDNHCMDDPSKDHQQYGNAKLNLTNTIHGNVICGKDCKNIIDTQPKQGYLLTGDQWQRELFC